MVDRASEESINRSTASRTIARSVGRPTDRLKNRPPDPQAEPRIDRSIDPSRQETRTLARFAPPVVANRVRRSIDWPHRWRACEAAPPLSQSLSAACKKVPPRGTRAPLEDRSTTVRRLGALPAPGSPSRGALGWKGSQGCSCGWGRALRRSSLRRSSHTAVGRGHAFILRLCALGPAAVAVALLLPTVRPTAPCLLALPPRLSVGRPTDRSIDAA